MEPSRIRILDAAARVYAEAGFRGATTRRIADEAGVNEITIFRQFGSKAALIDEALRCRSLLPGDPAVALPDEPRDPEAELTVWCGALLERLRASRSLIRKTMGEVEERPSAGPCATAPTVGAGRELKKYMQRMHDRGFVDWGECRTPGAGRAERARSETAHAAGAMLMAALFGDAMGRDVMPDLYPQPPERAAALYVGLFLCAIGARATPAARPTKGNGHSPKSPTSSPKSRR